jgi:hypothetical protein
LSVFPTFWHQGRQAKRLRQRRSKICQVCEVEKTPIIFAKIANIALSKAYIENIRIGTL